MKYYITNDTEGLCIWQSKPYWDDSVSAYQGPVGHEDEVELISWEVFEILTGEDRMNEGNMIEVECNLTFRAVKESTNPKKKKHY